MGDDEELRAEPVNPLSIFGANPPHRGHDYILPDILPAIKTNAIGYGCFISPNSSSGLPLIGPDQLNQCSTGFYCPFIHPNLSYSRMVVCPPDPNCFIRRIAAMRTCLPQGRYEPVPCLPGFYCPNPSAIYPCPDGHYCVSGTSVPVQCEFMSYCPLGSVTQQHYGLLLLAIIIDLFLLLLILSRAVNRYYHKTRPNGLKGLHDPITQRDNSPTNAILSMKEVDIRVSSKTREPGPGTTELGPGTTELGPGTTELGPGTTQSGTGTTEQGTGTTEQGTGTNSTLKLVEAFERGFNGRRNLQMEFQFDNLSYHLATGETILMGVTGRIIPKRMTAVMGPSGAGKTTFMNVLMGKLAHTGGDVKINGVTSNMRDFKRIIGYVPQEDVMHRDLTVQEVIQHSARMRLPSSWTTESIESHVDGILKSLGLQNISDSIIGDEMTRGISGGQRKRVNIGMELAAVPIALFLDEPTSGLDSTSALDVAEILRSISRIGLTIVAVIHQPRVEIFSKFDDVILLVPGGRTAYFGPANAARSYFEALGYEFNMEANPADIFMDILAGRGQRVNGQSCLTASELVSKFEQANGIAEEEKPPDLEAIQTMETVVGGRGGTFLAQFWHCHNRSLRQQSRDSNSLWVETFCAAFAGLIMGVSVADYEETFSGMLIEPYSLLSKAPTYWFLGLYGMLIGMSIALAAAPPGVAVFAEEKAIYWREAGSGHNTIAYYLAKTMSVIYRIGLSSAHFAGVYLFIGHPPYSIFPFFLIIYLQFFCVYGISVIVSMIVKRQTAGLLAVLLSLFMAVNCGFGITLPQARSYGIEWLFNIGPNRWAADAHCMSINNGESS